MLKYIYVNIKFQQVLVTFSFIFWPFFIFQSKCINTVQKNIYFFAFTQNLFLRLEVYVLSPWSIFCNIFRFKWNNLLMQYCLPRIFEIYFGQKKKKKCIFFCRMGLVSSNSSMSIFILLSTSNKQYLSLKKPWWVLFCGCSCWFENREVSVPGSVLVLSVPKLTGISWSAFHRCRPANRELIVH